MSQQTKKVEVLRRPKACFTYWRTDPNLGVSFEAFRRLKDDPLRMFEVFYANGIPFQPVGLKPRYETERFVRIMRAVIRTRDQFLLGVTSTEVKYEAHQVNIYMDTTEVSGEYRLIGFPAHPMDLMFFMNNISSLELPPYFKHFNAFTKVRDLTALEEKLSYVLDLALQGSNLQTIRTDIETFHRNGKVISETNVTSLHFIVDSLNTKAFKTMDSYPLIEVVRFELSVEMLIKHEWFFHYFIRYFPGLLSVTFCVEMEENFGPKKMSKWKTLTEFPVQHPDIQFNIETAHYEILQCMNNLRKVYLNDPNYDYYRQNNITITHKRSNLTQPFMQKAPLA